MQFILSLGDEQKTYEIGDSEDARRAIESYEAYLKSGEHAHVVQVYDHFFSIIAAKETTVMMTASIREAMALVARYMLDYNDDAEQASWFVNQANAVYTRFNIFPTQDIMNLQGQAIAKMMKAGVGMFAPAMQSRIQDFLQNRDSWVQHPLVRHSHEALYDFALPANTQKRLSAYTKKFFDKHREALPQGGDEGWKPYPKHLIKIEAMKNDTMNVIKLDPAKDDLAAVFARKLETHGFWAKVLPKTQTGIFVTANLTRSTGMKKSK
ncbi:MAG TPA: hypothetical protein VFU82_05800 [Gammaproteobacteria bacterium]|nr:hypothetical protein [Gammaproteobacteria bacterium]